PAVHTQFSVDIAEVAFYRLFADRELRGDFAIAVSLLDGGNDLNFTRRKSKACSGGLARPRPGRDRLTSHPELPIAHRPNTFQQQFGWRSLQYDATRAKLQSRGHRKWLDGGSEKDRPQRQFLARQLA